MRIALAQIAPPLGDPAGSLRLHLQTARRAVKAGADLVVFPELSLTGYRL
ncbi:MAG TPA: nitrilase-related carbon-nitrogen hydrolase, partial [Candidatus Polarisedimenticolia bacterium]|nr:nitrilase-related carbon-nitrogen hydrolase [Candidatus Polarisedimenticolia bacterium]